MAKNGKTQSEPAKESAGPVASDEPTAETPQAEDAGKSEDASDPEDAGKSEDAVEAEDAGQGEGAGEPDDVAAQEKPGRDRPAPLVIGLAAAVAVLVLLGGVMTTLFVQQRSVASERDRTIAAQQEQAEVAKAAAAQQEAKIKEIEAKLLDPKGYELIKQCVRSGAQSEQSTQAFMESAQNGNDPWLKDLPKGAVVERYSVTTAPIEISTVCREGEKALK